MKWVKLEKIACPKCGSLMKVAARREYDIGLAIKYRCPNCSAEVLEIIDYLHFCFYVIKP